MPDVPITRFQLLRGDIPGLPSVVRPPWALPETQFLSVCNRCGECVRNCGQGIVEQNRRGYPRINFSRGECTLCAACVVVCPTGALVPRNDVPPWTLRPQIDASCLSIRGTVCRVCAERCEPEAIRFHPLKGGTFRPAISHERCHGCGACVGVCPVQAIAMISALNPPKKN